jgi:ABC-2 type transport system permease protein
MGMGGAAAAEAVGPLQLFLCVPVSVIGIGITGQWWKNMQISSG